MDGGGGGGGRFLHMHHSELKDTGIRMLITSHESSSTLKDKVRQRDIESHLMHAFAYCIYLVNDVHNDNLFYTQESARVFI